MTKRNLIRMFLAGDGPAISFVVVRHLCRGCPRPCVFCKGGWRCGLRNLVNSKQNPVVYAFAVPALCKLLKGRGTPLFCLYQRSQKPGPPATVNAATGGRPSCMHE